MPPSPKSSVAWQTSSVGGTPFECLRTPCDVSRVNGVFTLEGLHMTSTSRRKMWCGTCGSSIAQSGDELEIPEFLKRSPEADPNAREIDLPHNFQAGNPSLDSVDQNGAGDRTTQAGTGPK